MKLTTKLATFAVVTLMASNAMAFSLAGNYYGPLYFKYTNYETLVSKPGDTLSGIFKVSAIHAANATDTLLWFDGKNGEELTGTFQDYVVKSITAVAGGQAIDFTGGGVTMYLDNTPDFNATAPGTGVTDGVTFMDFDGIGGIKPTEMDVTLRSTVDVLSSPFTGKGSGYLDLTYSLLSTFEVGSTWFLQSDVEAPGKWNWPVGSNDPLQGNAVPEPGTVALLGLGLAGLGLISRKRITNK